MAEFYITSDALNLKNAMAWGMENEYKAVLERKIKKRVGKSKMYEDAYKAVYGCDWYKKASYAKLYRLGKEITGGYEIKNGYYPKQVTYKWKQNVYNSLNNNYLTRYVEKEFGAKTREHFGWLNEDRYNELKGKVKAVKNCTLRKEIREALLKEFSVYCVTEKISSHKDIEKLFGEEIANEVMDTSVEYAKLLSKVSGDKYRITDFVIQYFPTYNVDYSSKIISTKLAGNKRKIEALKIMDEFKLGENFIVSNVSSVDVQQKLFSLLKAYDKAYKKDESAYEFLRDELINELRELQYVRAYNRCYSKLKLNVK